jgi:hypothetical protein
LDDFGKEKNKIEHSTAKYPASQARCFANRKLAIPPKAYRLKTAPHNQDSSKNFRRKYTGWTLLAATVLSPKAIKDSKKRIMDKP